MGRAVGILCRCALCDSYFVLELGTVDLTVYRGKKGKAALMDYFERLQARYDTTASETGADDSSDREFRDGRERSANGHEFMRCPTCVEATHGMRYAEWVARGGVFAASGRHSLRKADTEQEPEPEPERVSDVVTGSSDEDVALSLVEFVSFDEAEAPPLYLNEQGAPGKKPKWMLCQGVGPPALEVDSSRSGRVFKPSLRPFGIDRQMYQPLDVACALSRQQHIDVCTAVYNAVSLHNVDPTDIFAAAPVFLEWAKESSSIRSIIEEAAEAAAERDRVAASIKTAGMGATGSRGKPAERLAAALGIDFPEARRMIKKAKAGDVQIALQIADTIGFEVQMDAKPTRATTHSEADGNDGHGDFDFM